MGGTDTGVGVGDTSTDVGPAGSGTFDLTASSGLTDWVTLFRGCLLILKLWEAVTLKLVGGTTVVLVLELDLDLWPACGAPRTGDLFLSVLLELPAPVIVLKKLLIDFT